MRRRSTPPSACAIVLAFGVCIPTSAATIPVTYNFAGAPTTTPVVTGTTLSFDSVTTGSILSGNASLNARWNPVTINAHDVVDLTKGTNNAAFILTFADASTLTGNLMENVSQVLATNSGPFTQTLTFTGGTGEFAGATGSLSGGGLLAPTGFATSGSGTINAPAIPEPGSAWLLIGGLAVFAGVLIRRRRVLQ